MNAIAKGSARLTVEEFLRWAETAPGKWELADGQPRAVTPPLAKHGALLAELGRVLGNHLAETREDYWVVIDAGIIPTLFAAHNMRMPDLAVTCQPIGPEDRAIRAPVLIAEILSPSNEADTWNNVWAYTSIDSLGEILVLRADRVEAELLRRDAAGRWPAEPARLTGGELALDSVGFRVPLADLYRVTRLVPR